MMDDFSVIVRSAASSPSHLPSLVAVFYQQRPSPVNLGKAALPRSRSRSWVVACLTVRMPQGAKKEARLFDILVGPGIGGTRDPYRLRCRSAWSHCP